MKYLFKALLTDGTTIEQTQEDKSATVEGKNAFYDVLQNIDRVRAFALYDQATNDEYLVDLLDGRFEVKGCSFYLHDEAISNIRLVYFKRNVITVNQASIKLEGPVSTSFHFGFQCLNEQNQNKKYFIILQ